MLDPCRQPLRQLRRHERSCEQCARGLSERYDGLWALCQPWSPRTRNRTRMAERRRDPRNTWFYSLPWEERNSIRLALADRRTDVRFASVDAFAEHWAAQCEIAEAKGARRMARSLKRRRKVQP